MICVYCQQIFSVHLVKTTIIEWFMYVEFANVTDIYKGFIENLKRKTKAKDQTYKEKKRMFVQLLLLDRWLNAWDNR